MLLIISRIWVVVLLDVHIRCDTRPVSVERRECEYFSHNVRQLAVRLNICKVHDVLLAPIAYHVMPDVYLLGALGRHVISGHADCFLVVLVEKDWFLQLEF